MNTTCNHPDAKHELNGMSNLSKSRMGFLIDALKLSIGPDDGFDVIAWKVCDIIQDGLGWEDFAVFEVNRKLSMLKQIAVCGGKRLAGNMVDSPMQIPLGLGVCGFVALAGQGLLVTNVVDEPLYLVDDHLRFSELCVPIIVNGEVIGVLDAESSSIDYFNYVHFNFILELSRIVSQAITAIANERLN